MCVCVCVCFFLSFLILRVGCGIIVLVPDHYFYFNLVCFETGKATLSYISKILIQGKQNVCHSQ